MAAGCVHAADDDKLQTHADLHEISKHVKDGALVRNRVCAGIAGGVVGKYLPRAMIALSLMTAIAILLTAMAA